MFSNPRKFKIDDIINFDYDGKTYSGNIMNIVTIAQSNNGPFDRYAVVNSVFNEKRKTVKILLTRASINKYNVQLRYRHGLEENTTVANTQIIE